MMTEQLSAPRFVAYLEHVEGKPVLHMPRSDWSSMQVQTEAPVLIDVNHTPMAGISSNASIVAAYAQRFSSATAEVGITRIDLQDAPNIYNTDKYEVWEDLPSHQSFQQIISAASTEDNENLRQCLGDNVFFVKQDPDDEHQLPDPPATVRFLLDEYG